MKKSILSLFLVSMFVLIGCEKESVESIESSGSIIDKKKEEVIVFGESGSKSTLSLRGLINLPGNRKIISSGCQLGGLYFANESGGVNVLKDYVNCLSVRNFPITFGTKTSFKSTTHGIWSSQGDVYVIPSIAKAVEGAINNPYIVTKLREDRMNIAGVRVGNVVWPSSPTTTTSGSLGSFEIYVILTPKPFVPLF